MFKIIKEIREFINEFREFINLYRNRETNINSQLANLQQSMNHIIDNDKLSQFLQSITNKNVYIKTETDMLDGFVEKAGIIATYESTKEGLIQKSMKGFITDSDGLTIFVYPEPIKEYILKD